MKISDIFKRKQVKESNSMFGQTALGNNIVYQGSNQKPTVNTQILYVTTSSTTDAVRARCRTFRHPPFSTTRSTALGAFALTGPLRMRGSSARVVHH